MKIDNNTTREGLLDLLLAKQEELDLSNTALATNPDEDLKLYRYPSNWLLTRSVEMIKQALITNELEDY